MDDAASPVKHHFRAQRLAALFGALAALAAGYGLLFTGFYHETPAIENVIEENPGAATPPLEIYLEILSVDPVRQAVQVRLDFATTRGPYGLHFPGSPAKDVILHISDGADVQDVQLQASHPTSARTMQLDVRGPLENYPLDRYVGNLWIRAFEGRDLVGGAPVPVRLTTWEEIAGWEVALSKADSAGDESGLALVLRAHRPQAQIFFALVLYAAMILIAASALAIGGMVFLGTRKLEATLTGALGAMVFSVPALRNVLPGAPPLGVRADAFVFLWVQLAVILGLTLFVATWARRGPRP